MWLFLLCLLLGSIFTVFFGWMVKNNLSGADNGSRLGRAAVMVASFPSLVTTVLEDIRVDTLDRDSPVRVPRPHIDLSGFVPVGSGTGTGVTGLLMRADRQALAQKPGWRILVGAFTIDGEISNAALALSPDLQIEKIWLLTEESIDGMDAQPPHRKFIHGFELLDDGSVIFSFDGGVSLQRFGRCGARLWAIGGFFHHTVTLDDDGKYVWALRDREVVKTQPDTGDEIRYYAHEVVKVAVETGEIARYFSMDDIVAANPAINILQIRKQDDNDVGGNARNTDEKWLDDPFHVNDIEPLPAALAGRFAGFDAGDLLLSARSLNLVFVLDFMARLAALVPRPRVNLTRYHGVFAPNSPHRAWVTKAGRGRGADRKASDEVEEDTPAARRSAMTWAQRLKRVFRMPQGTLS